MTVADSLQTSFGVVRQSNIAVETDTQLGGAARLSGQSCMLRRPAVGRGSPLSWALFASSPFRTSVPSYFAGSGNQKEAQCSVFLRENNPKSIV